MGRHGRTSILASILMGASACAPVSAGPELPRPPTEAMVATTPPPTTTTTLDAETLLSTQCPVQFCLVYNIASAASWSDGTPVTATDFTRTIDAFSDRPVPAPSIGYDLVSNVDVIDQKRIRLGFSEGYGAWPRLFERLLAPGSETGDPFGMPTTGPFHVTEWVRGDRIVVQRNNEWWSDVDPLSGEPVGTLQTVTFVFFDDLMAMIDALEAGEVDVIDARPDVEAVGRLASLEGVEFTLSPGPFWEHIDFHHEDPLLTQDWARHALALAIDREEILDRTVRLLDPAAEPLDNTIFMTQDQGYQPHFDVSYEPRAAARILAQHGCERGDDDVLSCSGRRMSFRWATTTDDPARQETFEVIREDLAAVGIEIVGDFRNPSSFVSRDFLFGGADAWQLINFSWRAGSDPASGSQTYYCDDSDLNVNRYCSERVEALIRSAARITDPAARTRAYNQADALYLEDIAVIPLYQKPVLMAWSTALSGPEPNIAPSTDLWNIASWTGMDSIVIGLSDEPADLDPLAYDDESANTIMATLLYGAFGMDPSHQAIPVLVDSVDVIGG